MKFSLAPRVQSRSRSRGPGSLAGAPKTKTPRLNAQQAGAVPIRVMGGPGPLRIFSETCFLGSMSYDRPTLNGRAPSSVCDQCLVECDGVYRVGEKWLCAACNSPRAHRGSAASNNLAGNTHHCEEKIVVLSISLRIGRTGCSQRSARRRSTCLAPKN
jgi:hypothetical protein